MLNPLTTGQIAIEEDLSRLGINAPVEDGTFSATVMMTTTASTQEQRIYQATGSPRTAMARMPSG